jgi:hypothetical protein
MDHPPSTPLYPLARGRGSTGFVTWARGSSCATTGSRGDRARRGRWPSLATLQADVDCLATAGFTHSRIRTTPTALTRCVSEGVTDSHGLHGACAFHAHPTSLRPSAQSGRLGDRRWRPLHERPPKITKDGKICSMLPRRSMTVDWRLQPRYQTALSDRYSELSPRIRFISSCPHPL